MSMRIAIVGSGISGLCLAWILQSRGVVVHIFGDNSRFSATRHSAGMLNPITGWNAALSWNFDLFYSGAISFYQSLSDYFQQPVLQSYRYQRFFRSQREQRKLFNRYTAHPVYSHYITAQLRSGYSGPIQNKWGGYQMDRIYTANLPLIQSLLTAHFSSSGQLTQDRFTYHNLHPTTATYGTRSFDRVIFCEGYGVHQNPWFSSLPFTSQSSATLRIQSHDLESDCIYNYGKWLLPTANGFRLGSTHTPSRLSHAPEQDLYHHLVADLESMLTVDYRIMQMDIGYKTKPDDHRPVIGAHPHFPQLIMFNGFGGKGALAVPYCSTLLANHLLTDTPIPTEMSISRWT